MPRNDPHNLRVTITLPQPTSHVNRGAFEHVGEKARPRSFRLTDDDAATIDRCAHQLGLSFSEFVRWCAYNCAVEIGNELHRRTFDGTRVQLVKPPVDTEGYS